MPYIEPEGFRSEQAPRPKITGPMGWENDALPWYARIYRTLQATFAPIESLHAAANGEIAPALRFMLLSALPWMLAWAIIPFTHTMNFGPAFQITDVKQAGNVSVELDVVRAMGIGLAYEGLTELSWCIPFVSLLRAFSNGTRTEDPKRAGWRTALYRLWVVPCALALYFLVSWGLPAQPSAVAIELVVLGLQVLPRMLVLAHCHAMARYFGASGSGALVVSVVPLIVQYAVGLSLGELASKLAPVMPVPPT